jgi:hypothetical protein
VQALRWRDVFQSRLQRHSLLDRARPDQLQDVVTRMCGVHAQVQASAELALAIRVHGLTQPAVRHALWQQRSLVRTYGPRGTVHLFARDDLPTWLAALKARTPPRPQNQQELEALPPERMPDVLAAIADALQDHGLTRAELAAALEQRLGAWVTEKTFPAFGGFMPRWQLALSTAATEGILAFGPPRGSQVTYERLPPQPHVPGERALQEVFKRFLDAYGPASHVEFARWFLIHPAQAQQLQASVASQLEPVDVEGTRLWQLRAATYPEPQPAAHLLPQFDSYVVGSHPRSQLIPPSSAARLGRADTAAPFAVLLLGGVVHGVWSRHRKGKRLHLTVDAFREPTAAQRTSIEEQAHRLGEFFTAPAELAFGAVAPRGHL